MSANEPINDGEQQEQTMMKKSSSQSSSSLSSPVKSGPTTNNNNTSSSTSAFSVSSPKDAEFAIARAVNLNYNSQEQTHSTIAELSEAFRMFANADKSGANPEGIVPTPSHVISVKDLQTIMQQCGMRTNEKDLIGIIQSIDQNQIGNISFDEFCSLMGRSVPMEETEALQQAFYVMDKEKKGWVTTGQFTQLMSGYGEQSSPDEIGEMLQFADPNGSGRINYRVFLRMLGLRLH